MNHKIKICVAFCFAIIWVLCKTEAGTKFGRQAPLDGDICEGSDVVFSKSGISGTMTCLSECTNNVNCMSVFHNKGNEMCTGCELYYTTTNRPPGKSNGTKYYWKLKEIPDGWFDIGNSRYFITASMSYAEGKLFCLTHDSHPIRLETEEENTNIKAKIASDFSDIEFVYTAYTDEETENVWVDDNGIPLSFVDWGNSEPIYGRTENCCAFAYVHNYLWADIACSRIIGMVCEKELL